MDISRTHDATRATLRHRFAENIWWGGFPEVVQAGADLERTKILKVYFDEMFFKDLIERF